MNKGIPSSPYILATRVRFPEPEMLVNRCHRSPRKHPNEYTDTVQYQSMGIDSALCSLVLILRNQTSHSQ